MKIVSLYFVKIFLISPTNKKLADCSKALKKCDWCEIKYLKNQKGGL